MCEEGAAFLRDSSTFESLVKDGCLFTRKPDGFPEHELECPAEAICACVPMANNAPYCSQLMVSTPRCGGAATPIPHQPGDLIPKRDPGAVPFAAGGMKKKSKVEDNLLAAAAGAAAAAAAAGGGGSSFNVSEVTFPFLPKTVNNSVPETKLKADLALITKEGDKWAKKRAWNLKKKYESIYDDNGAALKAKAMARDLEKKAKAKIAEAKAKIKAKMEAIVKAMATLKEEAAARAKAYASAAKQVAASMPGTNAGGEGEEAGKEL